VTCLTACAYFNLLVDANLRIGCLIETSHSPGARPRGKHIYLSDWPKRRRSIPDNGNKGVAAETSRTGVSRSFHSAASRPFRVEASYLSRVGNRIGEFRADSSTSTHSRGDRNLSKLDSRCGISRSICLETPYVITTRRQFVQSLPAFAVVLLAIGTGYVGHADDSSAGGQAERSWHSQSLTTETVTGPNGAVTTHAALLANEKWGIGAPKRVEQVTDGVYAMRGWGLGSCFAVEAPEGWIIIDTGDYTRAAEEMRAMLEQKLGHQVKVAAILLTHWHYGDGIGAWLDEGAEVWGHEYLDRNRNTSRGISVLSGIYQARASAQFGVFHPQSGPDAFPNMLGFPPEKLTAESSYQAPTKLFPHGRVVDVVVAGEPVQVAPARSDTSDSVGFYFPRKRMIAINFMVPGGVFNVYTLRGGPYRNPSVFIEDARWIESKNAEILLDVHGPTVKSEDAVRDAVQRAVDQVQLIHDQTLRQISHGRDGRQAAEEVYIPHHLRGDWENYGQVESHVRQVYNGTLGWFGGDVYDINPLSGNEEAARTVQLMGGPAAVQKAAASANEQGGLANWRWTLKLTSLLLELDPADAQARTLRADAARQLGQRTSSANARGFYLTEALQSEGGMQFKGQPLTIDAIRRFLGTPTAQALVAATVDENLQFVRYLVDPRKAEGLRQTFTLAIEGEPQVRRIELRNGVLVITDADAAAPDARRTHAAGARRLCARHAPAVRGCVEPNRPRARSQPPDASRRG
jgi:alkyl sulfatase BDS1-like metallo-beta-lactamase superfamily hydrolase